ncbi:MAG: UDP-2,3-diacylglucosamine diphosphatase, partial [Bacteroidota bacterium]|nr:UDP-2,3-diacylglucosamine diphosphatase [Candidatus Kapabacteria bacterium]MDW8219692.1 UDP-2,3-diacylglucosamine diphosphatase [Bacteroidota bacterium]
QLILLGDVFDYWFEYATVVQKHHIRTLAALAESVDAGIAVEYVIGNHDFGHRRFFTEELGITVHTNDVVLQLNGKTIYAGHGDCRGERTTRRARFLRSVLRNPLALRAWSWLHPDIAIPLAAWVSQQSRLHASNTAMHQEQQNVALFAQQKVAEGYDIVVMGHTHVPVLEQLSAPANQHMGIYINTGDWLYHRTFALFDKDSIMLCTWQQSHIHCIAAHQMH